MGLHLYRRRADLSISRLFSLVGLFAETPGPPTRPDMTGMSSFHDLTITVRVEVTDPAWVLSHPSAMRWRIGPDGEPAVYVAGSVEEAVVARFTAMLDRMYEPSGGLAVCEHSERLAAWDRTRWGQTPHPEDG